MPISYTKRGWTNNSPPAINAANLGAMDDGLKNAIDALNNMGDAGQQVVKEIGEAPASTTGGKLVNKITEAGYSLAPATGTSNLDNIADGTTYKRITAAIATRLNTGKLYLPQYMARLGTETDAYSFVSLGGGIVLAGTYPTGQVYKSTDSGATWSLVQQLGTETYVLSLVSLGGGIVLAGTGPTCQIYRFSEVSL